MKSTEELAAGAVEWLLGAEVPDSTLYSGGAGVVFALLEAVAAGAVEWLLGAEVPDSTLYSGGAGVVFALLEAEAHFGDSRYGEAALRAARGLVAAVEDDGDAGLYNGLMGYAVALHAVDRRFGDADAAMGVRAALEKVRAGFDGERWGPMFELLAGNAGVGLGALYVGDLELALLAVTPYLNTADETPGGVNWAVRPSSARSHHLAHGTLGIVYALAAVGAAAGRKDLVERALAGAADVVARNEAGPEGFLVPHSDPQHRPDLIERYSYGWCNGPAGDAQVFRLLGRRDLEDRCWHTVTTSGLPQRIRPGFWDNNGRCCGTAGVLALALDRQVGRGDGLEFANVLVDDLAARATVDAEGVRWSNYEHKADPPALEPQAGWAMGSAGILRELLRFVRISRGDDPGYAVDWPDHPAAPRQ